jgi:uncharacterized protein YjaZ
MAVISTNQWLKEYESSKSNSIERNIELQKELLCEKLTPYYLDATSYEIHNHLLKHGLFLPSSLDTSIIDSMFKNDYWTIVNEEWRLLKKEWRGPNIPIFIFPSNIKNRQLRNDFNGISGLAHRDKVFLFVAGHTSTTQLNALFTHEYNHVCRLDLLNQNEEEIKLLDSLVLEGLAEMAVYERFGKDSLAKWTSEYPLEFALKSWDKWIKPNLDIKKADLLHHQFMYGKGKIPRWMGYNVGFHIVDSFVKNTQTKGIDLLRQPAKKILEQSSFIL